MKKYLILTSEDRPLGRYTKSHVFDTFEEAAGFASTLNFSVIIYEAVATTTIEHKIEKIKS